MPKVKLSRRVAEGFAGRDEEKVVEIADGEPIPEGAVSVPDDTPVDTNWRWVQK